MNADYWIHWLTLVVVANLWRNFSIIMITEKATRCPVIVWCIEIAISPVTIDRSWCIEIAISLVTIDRGWCIQSNLIVTCAYSWPFLTASRAIHHSNVLKCPINKGPHTLSSALHQLLFSSRFDGFKSLWTTPLSCKLSRNFTPSKSCNKSSQ